MDMQKWIGLMEVSRITGVPYWRITYAHRKGALPWPNRVVNTWVYNSADVERITQYFAAAEERRRKKA